MKYLQLTPIRHAYDNVVHCAITAMRPTAKHFCDVHAISIGQCSSAHALCINLC